MSGRKELETVERCETCKFWDLWEDQITEGDCRRGLRHINLPVVEEEHDLLYLGKCWAWPNHSADDWCGEYQPTPVPPADSQ